MVIKLLIAYEGEQLEVNMEPTRGSGIRRIPLVDSAWSLVGIVILDAIIKKLAQTKSHTSQVARHHTLPQPVKSDQF